TCRELAKPAACGRRTPKSREPLSRSDIRAQCRGCKGLFRSARTARGLRRGTLGQTPRRGVSGRRPADRQRSDAGGPMSKLLCLDVGNSQIYGGVYAGEHLQVTFRRASSIRASSDEFGVFFRSVLRENGIAHEEIEMA